MRCALSLQRAPPSNLTRGMPHRAAQSRWSAALHAHDQQGGHGRNLRRDGARERVVTQIPAARHTHASPTARAARGAVRTPSSRRPRLHPSLGRHDGCASAQSAHAVEAWPLLAGAGQLHPGASTRSASTSCTCTASLRRAALPVDAWRAPLSRAITLSRNIARTSISCWTWSRPQTGWCP